MPAVRIHLTWPGHAAGLVNVIPVEGSLRVSEPSDQENSAAERIVFAAQGADHAPEMRIAAKASKPVAILVSGAELARLAAGRIRAIETRLQIPRPQIVLQPIYRRGLVHLRNDRDGLIVGGDSHYSDSFEIAQFFVETERTPSKGQQAPLDAKDDAGTPAT